MSNYHRLLPSQALRRGAKKADHQVTGSLVKANGAYGYCAAGAIGLGWDFTVRDGKFPYFPSEERLFKKLHGFRSADACWTTKEETIWCWERHLRLGSALDRVIIHMNDQHDWTFEQIAEALEQRGL